MVNVVYKFFLIVAVTVNGCERNWKLFGNHCYVMVERLESWHASMEYCKAFSAFLVTIDEPEEFRFLQDTLRASHRPNDTNQPIIEYWTAGNDIIVESHWVWAPSNEEMEFSAWAPGEPNQNLNGIDDCAGLFNWQDFQMNDDNCDEPRYFICEQDQQYCHHNDMKLAQIEDAEEFQFIRNTLKTHYDVRAQEVLEFWIDGYFIASQRQWVWDSRNENVNFFSWAPGEPNGIENCIDLLNHEDFYMNDDKCEYAVAYICEDEYGLHKNEPFLG